MIVANAYPMPKWFENAGGIIEPDSFYSDPDLIAEIGVKKAKLLYEKLGDVGLGSPDAEPVYAIPVADGRVVMAVAFGADEPVWRSDVASYLGEGHPWANITSVQDVKNIKIPDWDNQPLVQKMVAKYQEIQSRSKYRLPGNDEAIGWLESTLSYPYPPRSYTFTHYANFIDTGPSLMGPEEFFVTLAADPDLGRALMDKCFELITSYFDYLRKLYNRPEITALGSYGGDNSCALSPSHYRDFAMAYDLMLIDRYGNHPVNLHSCGPSAHLYDVWATYPEVEDIVFMQTRGIESEASRLRQALPNAVLEITIHPPQFDFEYETPENVRRVVHHYAEAVGFRDAVMQVLFVEDNERVYENVRALYRAVDEINESQAA